MRAVSTCAHACGCAGAHDASFTVTEGSTSSGRPPVASLQTRLVAAEEGAEAEIWSVTDITEEELVQEEGEKDVVDALLELAEWECVEVEEV